MTDPVERRSAPDGDREHLYQPLSEIDARLAEKLRWRYARRWVNEAGLSANRLQDAFESVELLVGPPDDDGLRELRVRSFFTGTTSWFDGWDGSASMAERYLDEAADLQAGNVEDEREESGPTPWDIG